MNRKEMLLEIEAIKYKLAYGCESAEQSNLLIALLALYEAVIARDTKKMDDELLVEWTRLLDESGEEKQEAA